MNPHHGNLQKYLSRNLLQRVLIRVFLERVTKLTQVAGGTRVLDAGCAEGFVGQYLSEHLGHPVRYVGVDVDRCALRYGKRVHPDARWLQGNVLKLPFPEGSFDLVLCNEVMEHLIHPQLALQEISRVTRKRAILSVPHEPWFRLANLMRGKHISRWGNDPEHLHNWGINGIARLIESEMDILQVINSFPWTLVLAEKRMQNPSMTL